MIHTYLAKNKSKANPKLTNGMFSLRHHIFKERMNWEVKSYQGKEIDNFDNDKATYIISADKNNFVNGCMRIIPTNHPYMLEKVFPVLLQGEKIPKSRDIWEVSRFATRPDPSSKEKQCSLGLTSLEIWRESVTLAMQHDVKEIIAVTSVSVEQLFRRTGLEITRFGNGKATRIGRVLSVACRMKVNQKALKTIDKTIKFYRQQLELDVAA